MCVRSCVGQLHGHAWASGGGYVSMYGLCNRLGFLGGFVDAGHEGKPQRHYTDITIRG